MKITRLVDLTELVMLLKINSTTVEPLLYDHPQNHIGVVV